MADLRTDACRNSPGLPGQRGLRRQRAGRQHDGHLSLVRDIDGASRGKPRDSQELRLLRDYCRLLVRAPEPLSPALAAVCRQHVVDLTAMALGAHREAAEQVAGGPRHARLLAIRADIEANHSEPWLNVETVARRHGISPQYLRSLFYREGETFSDVVREVRLKHAMRMLTDPAPAEIRVSDVAYACGFGDLSHFNLVFRRRYGMTPSEAKADAATRHKRKPQAETPRTLRTALLTRVR